MGWADAFTAIGAGLEGGLRGYSWLQAMAEDQAKRRAAEAKLKAEEQRRAEEEVQQRAEKLLTTLGPGADIGQGTVDTLQQAGYGDSVDWRPPSTGYNDLDGTLRGVDAGGSRIRRSGAQLTAEANAEEARAAKREQAAGDLQDQRDMLEMFAQRLEAAGDTQGAALFRQAPPATAKGLNPTDALKIKTKDQIEAETKARRDERLWGLEQTDRLIRGREADREGSKGPKGPTTSERATAERWKQDELAGAEKVFAEATTPRAKEGTKPAYTPTEAQKQAALDVLNRRKQEIQTAYLQQIGAGGSNPAGLPGGGGQGTIPAPPKNPINAPSQATALEQQARQLLAQYRAEQNPTRKKQIAQQLRALRQQAGN